jgi:GNAT superfamily N-acetyltransferase
MFPIKPLKITQLEEAVDLIFKLGLDTREEIEHHLKHTEAHFVAMKENKIVGVIGWYQDNVNYANEAMGNLFPGEDAYWVGFFGVKKEYQNKGVGTSLMKHLESVVREKGETELWVSSVPETKSFYEKLGFVLIKQGEISGNRKYFLKKSL